MAKKNKKIKPLIISVVILSVIGYLVYAGVRDTMTYYLNVSEVLANPHELPISIAKATSSFIK